MPPLALTYSANALTASTLPWNRPGASGEPMSAITSMVISRRSRRRRSRPSGSLADCSAMSSAFSPWPSGTLAAGALVVGVVRAGRSGGRGCRRRRCRRGGGRRVRDRSRRGVRVVAAPAGADDERSGADDGELGSELPHEFPQMSEGVCDRPSANGQPSGCAGSTSKLSNSTRAAYQVFQCSVRYGIFPSASNRNTKQ